MAAKHAIERTDHYFSSFVTSGMSDGLTVWTQAPTVSVPLVRPDSETETVALETLYEDRPILLTFYTNDFTPDCIEEWCSFRDYEWFATDERGGRVF